MNYKKLSDVLYSIGDYDLEEVAWKLGFNFKDIKDKKEVCEKLQDAILKEISNILKPYSKNTIEYLSKVCLSKDLSYDFDMDYNTLVCDGLCYLAEEGGVKKVKVTSDLAGEVTKLLKGKDSKKIIDKYDETEKVIMGIIKVYGIVTPDEIYSAFSNVKNENETEFDDQNNFEHFLYYRDNILKEYAIFEKDGDEYFFGEQIEDPEEVLEELDEDTDEIKLFTRDEYIKFSEGSIFVTDEKALEDFRELISSIIDNESQTEDVINTVMYDIKMGNLDDLMIDIMTYASISTDEEHEEIKAKLSTLYKSTPTWKGRYLK